MGSRVYRTGHMELRGVAGFRTGHVALRGITSL